MAPPKRPLVEAEAVYGQQVGEHNTQYAIFVGTHFHGVVPRRPPMQLPPASRAELVGRDTERATLRERLERGDHTIAVVGPAGFGKTALAAAALRDVVGSKGEKLSDTAFADGVLLLDLYRRHAPADGAFDAVSDRRQTPADGAFDAVFDRRHTPADAVLDAVADDLAGEGTWLGHRPRERARRACAGKRLLIILEGAERADGNEGRIALADLLEVFGEASHCRLVLTRDQSQAHPYDTVAVASALSQEHARELALRLLGQMKRTLPPSLLNRMLALVDGHPLALSWAAGTLSREDEDPDYLIECWERSPFPALPDPDPVGRERTLERWYARALDSLSDVDRTLVFAAAALSAAPVPFQLFREFPAQSSADARASAQSDEGVRDALKRLVRTGLLRRSDRASTWEFTHTLTYKFSRANRLAPELLVRLAGALKAKLASTLEQAPSSWSNLGELLAHGNVLLSEDGEHLLWDPLGEYLLTHATLRLLRVGAQGHAELALSGVAVWLDGLRARQRHKSLPWAVATLSAMERMSSLALHVGALDAAKERAQIALSLSEQLTRDFPDDLGLGVSHGALLRALGEVSLRQHNYVDAEAHFSASIELLDTLEPSSANDESRAILCLALNQLGTVHRFTKDLDRAWLCFERSRLISAPAVALAPESTEWLEAFYSALEGRAQVQSMRGEFAHGKESFLQARTYLEQLLSKDPDCAAWRRNLSVSYNCVAEVMKCLGDLEGADESCERSLEIISSLAEADPENPLLLVDLAYSRRLRADVRLLAFERDTHRGDEQLAQDLTKDALESYQLAANALGWLEHHETRTVQRLMHVVLASGQLAKRLSALTRHHEALTCRRRAVALLHEVTELDPACVGTDQVLMAALSDLGMEEAALGQLNAAAVTLSKAVTRSRAAVSKQPCNHEARLHYAQLLEGLADVQWQRGRATMAADWYELCLEQFALLESPSPDHAMIVATKRTAALAEAWLHSRTPRLATARGLLAVHGVQGTG